ncbi:MAG: SH3 domain-containing protein [Nitrospinae bacterium]|nr:SH3 domain-containing protein [Nitrospinota bacterium]
MKKLLVVLSLFVFSAGAWAEEVMVNSKDAKIRSGPGTSYAILWKPNLYTPLEVLAKHQDWYAVRDLEKDVGWVNSGSVSKGRGAIVSEKVIDVHESGDANSRVVYQAPKNYTFKITEDKEGWAKVVDADGESGWIQKKGVWTGVGAVEEKKQAKGAKKEKKDGKKPKKSAKEQKHGEQKKSE